MVLTILGGVFVVALVLGVPIGVALGIASVLALVFGTGIPPAGIPQRVLAGMDSFALLAIPCFILAGSFMNYGGITRRIIVFANALVGRFTGGLALMNIVASLIFAGKSGSAVADTSAVGGVLIPAMIERGYDRDYTVAVTASSSGIAAVIPPSITLVVYGVITGTSITSLFLAGIVPGIVYGLGLMVVAFAIAKKRGYAREAPVSLAFFLKALKEVVWALLTPIIILAGLVGGIFTVTEAAAVAAVYAFLVGLFVYRELKLSHLPQILYENALLVASIMLIISMAELYKWVLVLADAPGTVANWLFTLTQDPIILLLLINMAMLALGIFMEANAAIVITVPILFPVVVAMGVDPVHFGIMMVFNLCLGLVTPPVGLCLNLAAKIARLPVAKALRATLPFFGIGVAVLLLITLLPAIATTLPAWVRGLR